MKVMQMMCCLLMALCLACTPSQSSRSENESATTVAANEGLDRHDFFYAGERRERKMYMVKNGRVVWSYDDPAGKGEISDAILLTDGHILMAHQYGLKEIDKKQNVIWSMDVPEGYEVHSIQPIGKDKVLYVQCGDPFEAVVMEVPSMKELKRIPLPFINGRAHGQMRNMRLSSRGTMLLASFEYGAVIEFDSNGNELRRWEMPKAWGVEELKDGNILVSSSKGKVCEFTLDGKVVWEYDWEKQGPESMLNRDGELVLNISTQKAHRLKNGNTMITNWLNMWNTDRSDPAVPAVQAIEVTPEGQTVWQLKSWQEPADLGPATTIQLLSEPVNRKKLHFGEFR